MPKALVNLQLSFEKLCEILEHFLLLLSLSQEREYKEALEAFNEKNKEKVQLITRLMEVSS